MNSLKTMLMIGILVVVAYGMYVSINSGPVQAPPEVTDDWAAGPPDISLPGADSQAPPFAMEGPGALPAPGMPSIEPRSDSLSPARPFSERAPAPPFDMAPMPPEIASKVQAPMSGAASDAPPYPSSYAQSAPPIGTNANVPNGSTQPPLPDINTGVAPPNSPPTPSNTLAGIEQLADPATPDPNQIRPAFAQFLAESRGSLEQGRFRETLAMLSSRYGEPDQTQAEATALTNLLDQLAGTVIYSTEHHLEPAHVVQAGETLPQIAEKYAVPTELLAKINSIQNPMQLQPGQKLKVVRGPFRAVVHLDTHEMVMWLQDLYAGRFPIGVGSDKPDLTGNFEVLEKNREPTYYSPSNRAFDPGDPLNPLGKRSIGLGNSVAIHGTNDESSIGQTGGPGAVRLGERDADDVFDILSLGSRVVIQR